MFAAVAPGGKVRHAIRGARVDEHICDGYHADAGAREAARRPTRPADTRSFWASFSPLQRCQQRPAAATSGENDAQKERASAGLVRLRAASRAPASAWYPARMCSSTRAPRIARRTFPPGATAANIAILADFGRGKVIWPILSSPKTWRAVSHQDASKSVHVKSKKFLIC